LSEGAFPPTARRFESVGFSEIVKVRNRVMELLAAGQKVWRFEGGEPWMDSPEPVKAAMGDALSRNQTRYAPSSGIPELRRTILEKVRTRNGIPCDDEAPVVVNGGMQGLFAAFSTLLDPGDEVLLFSPYWTPIVDLIGYHKAQAVLVPTAAARRQGLASALAKRPRRERSSSIGTRRTIPRATSSRGRRPKWSRSSRASAVSPSSRTRPTKTSSTRASRSSRSDRCPA